MTVIINSRNTFQNTRQYVCAYTLDPFLPSTAVKCELLHGGNVVHQKKKYSRKYLSQREHIKILNNEKL